MPAYDIHQHFWPEPFLDVLRRRRRPPRIADGRLELEVEGASAFDPRAHTVAGRLALLDRDGIDVGLVSLPPTLETERVPEEESRELIDAYHEGMRAVTEDSGGRIAALAVNACLDGFAGASVGARALVDRPAWLEPLLGELAAGGRLLFVHPEVPAPPTGRPRWWSAVVDYTAQMQAAYLAWLAWAQEAHPDVRVVFSILAGGAPVQAERLESRGVAPASLRHPNVFFDTASYGRRALELAIACYGVEQILFGTDVPVIDAGPMLAEVASLGPAAQTAILQDNPARILG